MLPSLLNVEEDGMGDLQAAVASSAMSVKNLKGNVGYARNRAHKGKEVTSSSNLSTAVGVVEPAANPKQNAVTRIYRCRFYRLPIKRLAGQQLFTEVWDFQEQPHNPANLPKGTALLATFTGTSVSGVRAKLDPYRLQNGYILSGDWASRGSI
jgi:hypothetical protein